MASVLAQPPSLSFHPCERKPSYTAPTKTPSPLRHATSYSSHSSSASSSDMSDSDSLSLPPTLSKSKSGHSALRFDLTNELAPTKPKRFHLLPVIKRQDNSLIQYINALFQIGDNDNSFLLFLVRNIRTLNAKSTPLSSDHTGASAGFQSYLESEKDFFEV
ncbi:hypothetical protein C0991_010373 [Blastosporella zonata]|nr:hypothetical protein C0991_010373 [Blastosporella zonata]